MVRSIRGLPEVANITVVAVAHRQLRQQLTSLRRRKRPIVPASSWTLTPFPRL
jgi:hypothetical protein